MAIGAEARTPADGSPADRAAGDRTAGGRVYPPHLFDATVSLAELLGLPLEQTVEALGAGWERCVVRGNGEDRTWFAAGEPVQVLVGVDAEQVLVACPVEQPDGGPGGRPGTFAVHVLDSRPWWDADLATWLRRTVVDAQRRRRRSFRYCRYCRLLVPPEGRHSQDVCRRCAARYLG